MQSFSTSGRRIYARTATTGHGIRGPTTAAIRASAARRPGRQTRAWSRAPASTVIRTLTATLLRQFAANSSCARRLPMKAKLVPILVANLFAATGALAAEGDQDMTVFGSVTVGVQGA